MSVIAEIIGTIFVDVVFWPAEWLTERLWHAHRKQPPLRRWLGGTVLVFLTVLLWVLYIALLIGIVVGIYLLATK